MTVTDTATESDRRMRYTPAVADDEMLEVYLSDGACATHDLAREGWLLERAAAGQACMLLYSWPSPVVVLGYGQRPEDADLGWCSEQGIPVLRRLTGGTGVVHHRDLAVSLALPRAHPWAAGIVGLYDHFLSCLEPALNAVGGAVERKVQPSRAGRIRSPICFEEQTADTLLSAGRKVVGCAQTRRSHAVMIHAAVLLGVDLELYAHVFRVAPARVAAALGPAVSGRSWREVGDSVVEESAHALTLRVAVRGGAPLDGRYLGPYAEKRWAPVPEITVSSDRKAK